MAWGINAVYSAREKENDNPVETIVLDTGELDTDELILNRFHNMGLLFTKETSMLLVLIISNTPHCQFDIMVSIQHQLICVQFTHV